MAQPEVEVGATGFMVPGQFCYLESLRKVMRVREAVRIDGRNHEAQPGRWRRNRVLGPLVDLNELPAMFQFGG